MPHAHAGPRGPVSRSATNVPVVQQQLPPPHPTPPHVPPSQYPPLTPTDCRRRLLGRLRQHDAREGVQRALRRVARHALRWARSDDLRTRRGVQRTKASCRKRLIGNARGCTTRPVVGTGYYVTAITTPALFGEVHV